jgi:hypothetical protein
LSQSSEQLASPPSHEQIVAPIDDEADEIRDVLAHYSAAAQAQSKLPQAESLKPELQRVLKRLLAWCATIRSNAARRLEQHHQHNEAEDARDR